MQPRVLVRISLLYGSLKLMVTRITQKDYCHRGVIVSKLLAGVHQLDTEFGWLMLYNYHHSMKLYRKISRVFLPSVLLRVHSTSNNANGNKRVIFFSGITWCYGDNDFII